MPSSYNFKKNADIDSEGYAEFISILASKGYEVADGKSDQNALQLPLSFPVQELPSFREATKYEGTVTVSRPKDYAAEISVNNLGVFYFSLAATDNEALKQSILSGKTGQRVSFMASLKQNGAGVRLAQSVKALDDEYASGPYKFVPKGAPAKTSAQYRSGSAREDMSLYRKAKDMELRGNTTEAERYFIDSIRKEPLTKKSAIKDLCQLLNRLGRAEEAIEVLEENKSAFGEIDKISLMNMRAHFYSRAGNFNVAAGLYKEIAKSHNEPKSKVAAIKQAAYAYFKIGNYTAASEELQRIRGSVSRDDTQFLTLVAEVEKARLSGGVPSSSDERISVLSKEIQITELGPIARHGIENCRFEMVDERSRERGYYGEDDVRALTAAFNRTSGERPALRAQIAQNIAAIYHSAASLFNEEEARRNVILYLTFSAEAAFVAGDVDVVLSYLHEALGLTEGMRKGSDTAKVFRMVLAALRSPRMDAGDFFKVAGREIFSPQDQLNRMLEEYPDSQVRNLAYVTLFSRPLYDQVMRDIRDAPKRERFNRLYQEANQIKEKCETVLSTLIISSGLLNRDVAQTLQRTADSMLDYCLDLDKRRFHQLSMSFLM